MKKNRLILTTVLTIFTVFSMLTFSSYAIENNFLRVDIREDNNTLLITEQWNVQATEQGVFKRTIPLDETNFKNIYIERQFPIKEALAFDKQYKGLNNETTISINNEIEKGNTVVLDIQYSLTLDKKTKNDFIESLPNSLFSNKNSQFSDLVMDIDVNGEDYYNSANKEISQITDNEVAKEFKQETSKTQLIDVFTKLFKILVRILLLLLICFIVYTLSIFIYYRSISKIKRRFKKRKTKTHFKIK